MISTKMVNKAWKKEGGGEEKPEALKPGTLKPGALKPGTLKPGSLKTGALKPGTLKPGALKPGALKPGEKEDEVSDVKKPRVTKLRKVGLRKVGRKASGKVSAKSKKAGEAEGGREGSIEIRKYSNRRLYCTTLSEYIVHEDVAEMIRQGKEVVVRDAKTGEDITRTVLTQIILDAEGKDENSLLPLSFLRSLISLYGNGVNHFLLPRFLEQSIRTFEDSTRGFEHYLDSLFDDMSSTPVTGSLMNPLKNVNSMNRKVYEMNKEMMRDSMKMMMGEGWSSMKGFDKAISNEEREKIAVSQKRLHKRLLGGTD